MEQVRVGQQLGNYRLIRSLGSGGYATVYLGEHITLKSQAAIKVLTVGPLLLTDKERNRFLREANTIRRLSHPHIIRVLECGIEVGASGSIPYIVMHYAAGGNIKSAYVPGTPLPLDVIRSYTGQITDGLQYAHNQGVVHCDIKPENMLVGKLKEILLGDFGIADLSHTADISELDQESPLYTSMIQGTIGYMAPERFLGHIRRASDQYSLGVVAYEWLIGELPFTGNKERIMYQHINVEPPSICARRPEISMELEAVVMKALAKEPEQRYPSVQEFFNALDQAMQAIQSAHPASVNSVSTISAAKTQAMPGPALDEDQQDQRVATPAVSSASAPPDNQQVPQMPVASNKVPAQEQEISASQAQEQPAPIAAAPPDPVAQGAQQSPIQPPLMEPIVLQAANLGSGQGQQNGPNMQQQPPPNRNQWYQQNYGGPDPMFVNDPNQSTTINIRPHPYPKQGAEENEFINVFTAPVTVAQHWFALEPEFAIQPEFRLFRSFGMFLNVVSVVVIGLLLRSWTVGLICGLAPVAFWLCIRLVRPVLAAFIGILLAAYWGWVALTMTVVLIRLPLFATLPGPEIMGVIVFFLSAALHLRYVTHRNA